jgi:cysteine desulfurase
MLSLTKFISMRVYLDNAATTQIAPEVIDSMLLVLKENFGNPSSTHFYGRNAKALVETSRRSIAKQMNCLSSEIIFTSGGTEADNMAIHAAINELGVKRIITSCIEHHAVGHTIESLTKENLVESVFVKIDSKGHVDLNHLEELLQENIPTLVSLLVIIHLTYTI